MLACVGAARAAAAGAYASMARPMSQEVRGPSTSLGTDDSRQAPHPPGLLVGLIPLNPDVLASQEARATLAPIGFLGLYVQNRDISC